MADNYQMDLVSSMVMLITTRLAAKPNLKKFPVGRKRAETVGVILFCALITTVSIELIVSTANELSGVLKYLQIESARALAAGPKNEDRLDIIPLIFVGVASKRQ
jgi:divalent metal cation (Fe/Co/Zn/Cd) transporter